MRFVSFVMALVWSTSIFAGQWYDPDNPGHGVSWDAIGDSYQAQWYFHDGVSPNWVVTDVCELRDVCPLYTIDAYGFPAQGASLVDAGHVLLMPRGEVMQFMYHLDIPEVGCWSLPGPLPPNCRDEFGNPDPTLVYRRGIQENGNIPLRVLVD